MIQLSKRVNRNRLQTEIPISDHFLQSGEKGSTQDSVGGFLKEHDYLKAIDIISGIRGPIVALQLRNFEVWYDRFLKNTRHKRRFGIESVGWC